MTDDLIKLAERVEALSGPDFQVEADIALATGLFVRERRGKDQKEWYYPVGEGVRRSTSPYGYRDRLPRYTASLDAAMTLAENSGYAGLLLLAAHNAIAERFARECLTTDEYRTALARAFCAAALRARGAEQ